MVRKTLTVALILALSNYSLLATAGGPCTAFFGQQGGAKRITREEAVRFLDRTMLSLERLRGAIDRSQFDLEALLEKLDYDAENISSFVKDEIYFEQYVGLLRGAQGTLMSRAGNDLDQAVLLATLLRQGGYEVRIARGELGASESESLLKELARARKPRPPYADLAGMQRVFDQHKEWRTALLPENSTGSTPQQGQQSEKRSLESLRSEADGVADSILELLSRSDVSLGGEGALDLRQGVKDYFWVQYRVAREAWTPIHPAFATTSESPADLSAVEFFGSSIPESLQHRLRFQVRIDQRFGSSIRTHELMSAWEGPVANLVGRPLEYLNYPDGLQKPEDWNDVAAGLERTNFFVPSFNQGLPAGGLFFDVQGNAVPPDAASSPFAGVFQTVSQKGNLAASEISNLGRARSAGDQPLVGLEAQWLEFTLIAPGGQARKFVRNTLADLTPGLDSAESREARLRRALGRVHTFMLSVGEYPQGYVLDRQLSSLISFHDVLKIALEGSSSSAEPPAFTADALSKLEARWLGHFPLYSAFDQRVTADAEQLDYRPAPSLVIYTQSMGNSAGAEWIDIVNSEHMVVATDTSSPQHSPQQAVRAGVWEALVESEFLSSEQSESFSTVNAMKRPGSQELLTLRGDGALPSRLQVSDSTRAAITQDLEAGFVVVVPSRMAFEDEGVTGWWKIDPRTGETYGMVSPGFGGSVQLAERVTVKMIAMALLGAVLVFGGCYAFGSEDDDQLRQCTICALIAVAAVAVLSLAWFAAPAAAAGGVSWGAGFAIPAAEVIEVIASVCAVGAAQF